MKWALVKDNKVYNVSDYLPRKLNGIPEPQLKENGWYIIQKDTTFCTNWQTSTSNYTYDSQSDTVIETKTIVNISLDDWKDKKYSQLRIEIEQYIYSQYPSYKQLSALAGFYTTEENTSIVNGVKALFDIAINMKTALYSATDYQSIDDIYYRKNIALDNESENWVFWGNQ